MLFRSPQNPKTPSSTKNGKDYLIKLYELLNTAVYGFGGAVIASVGYQEQMLSNRLVKGSLDLKRLLARSWLKE